MNNFSFKQFIENKDLNEVGQHVFPDDKNDPAYKKPFHNSTVKQVEDGGYADTENKFDGNMPVLKVKNIKNGIEVELGGMIKSRLLTSSGAGHNTDPRTGQGMNQAAQDFGYKYDKPKETKWPNNSDVTGFYKGIGKQGASNRFDSLHNPKPQETNYTTDIILKSMMKVAAQIIIDNHQYSRIISFKPVFDWLQNPRKDRPEFETRIALMYTTLDKGLKMIIREASKKINAGKQNWDKKYTLEKVGHDIQISSGSPLDLPLDKNTDDYDKAIVGDKETNIRLAQRRAKVKSRMTYASNLIEKMHGYSDAFFPREKQVALESKLKNLRQSRLKGTISEEDMNDEVNKIIDSLEEIENKVNSYRKNNQ